MFRDNTPHRPSYKGPDYITNVHKSLVEHETGATRLFLFAMSNTTCALCATLHFHSGSDTYRLTTGLGIGVWRLAEVGQEILLEIQCKGSGLLQNRKFFGFLRVLNRKQMDSCSPIPIDFKDIQGHTRRVQIH